MIIKLLVDAGDMKPGPTISQKLGPLGINIGKVIQEINTSTSGFKGLKVPVELDINPKTKNFSVKVFSPSVSELIKKELSLEKASGDHKKIKVGNLAIEQVIKISKTKSQNMLDKSLKAAVKSVVGSCASLGVLIENKSAKEIEKDIMEGKYDDEIKQEKINASAEKIQGIKKYFSELKAQQDKLLKTEEEERLAAEAAKTKEATTEKPAETEKKVEEKVEEKKAKK